MDITVYIMETIKTKNRKLKYDSTHIVAIKENGKFIFKTNRFDGKTHDFVQEYNINNKGVFAKVKFLTIDANKKFKMTNHESLLQFKGDGESFLIFDSPVANSLH